MPFLLSISSAFAHTRCISPSVCLLKSFMQASTFAPSPFSARASAIRSRTCGRQRLAFLAVSATGGARKPNPSEGGEGAPAPRTKLTHCGKEDSNERNPSGVSFVFVQVAFALQRRGEGAPAPCTELMPRNSFIVRRSYSPRLLVRYSAFLIPDYLLQIALLPQGSAMSVAVTGRPISSAETLPPNFFILTPSTYSMVEAESPVV